MRRIIGFHEMVAVGLGLVGGVGCASLLGDFSFDHSDAGDAATTDQKNDGSIDRVIDSTQDAVLDDVTLPTADAVEAAVDETCSLPASCCNDAADLQIDENNCGRCGHDCQGGSCLAGQCQPIVLASNQGHPSGIALSPTNVYWTNNSPTGSVAMTSTAGGAVTTLASDQNSPIGISIDASNAYWVNYGSAAAPDGAVMRCALAGCGGSPTPVASGRTAPWSITLSNGDLFWTEGVSVFKNGSTLAAEINNPYALLIASSIAIWTDSIGRIQTCLVGGCAGNPTAITPSVNTASYGLATDSVYLYWSNSVGGTIQKATLSGGNLSILAAAQASPVGVAVDSQNVYWANQAGGTIMRCAVSGCANNPSTVASGQSQPVNIAVDSVSIYWTNMGDGTIMKVAKP